MRNAAASFVLVSASAFCATLACPAINGLDAGFATGGIVLPAPTHGCGISNDRIPL